MRQQIKKVMLERKNTKEVYTNLFSRTVQYKIKNAVNNLYSTVHYAPYCLILESLLNAYSTILS